jgi:hypothetical protein
MIFFYPGNSIFFFFNNAILTFIHIKEKVGCFVYSFYLQKSTLEIHPSLERKSHSSSVIFTLMSWVRAVKMK